MTLSPHAVLWWVEKPHHQLQDSVRLLITDSHYQLINESVAMETTDESDFKV